MTTIAPEHMIGPVSDPDDTSVNNRNGRNALVKSDARLPQNIPTHLGELSDIAFDRAVSRAKVAQKRMVKLFDEVLIEDAHYGNPKQKNGRPAFNRPILYKQGADDLCQMFRLTPIQDANTPDVQIATEEFTSYTATRLLVDIGGNVVDRATAACNTKEKRFRKYDGSGWVYQDSRECLNDCIAMAEKRAKDRMTVSTLGLGTYLLTEGSVEKDINEDEKPITPWSAEEKKVVYEEAATRGLSRKALESLVQDTLGRSVIGSADVAKVRAAVAKWESPKKEGKPEAKVDVKPELPAELREEETDEDILRQDREMAEREAGSPGELPLNTARKSAPSAQSQGH